MRKILVSLLVVAMVLGLVGSAFGYSDTAKDANAAYIDKVSAFSWMKGYPDGTFKPAGNITRAEFAAVVVRALGLDSAASSTAGLATKFKDVASTHWAAGYINVATNKGIAKGYPDGSFKPEANVTNAEAITMVVRALNREADAVGEWPVGHISAAAQVSIIGAGFASSALATRADVSRYIAKAADVKHKELTTNGWVESTDKTFLKYNTLEKLTGTVTNTDTTNRTITMNVTTPNLGANTYTLDANGLIANNVSLLDLKGYSVDVFRNKDTSKLVFVEPSTTTTVKKGTARAVGSNYFYLVDDSAKYEMATVNTVIRNFNTGAMTDLKADDEFTFFIGSDGKVSYLNARGYDKYRYIITDMYTAGTPYSITARSGSTTVTYTLATDCKVELNGVEAKIGDLAKGDIVSIAGQSPSSNVATIVNASDKVVNGKITAKRMTVQEDATRYFILIDGVEYRFEGTSEVKDNETTYNSAATIYNGAVKIGQTVAATLSQRGRIRVLEIVSGIADMGKIKRFVTNTSGSYDSWVLDMKGTETTYEVAKASSGTSKHADILTASGAAVGDYVALALDNDGRIDSVTKLVNIAIGSPDIKKIEEVYSGDKIVTIGGVAYLVTNDTLLYVNDVVGSMGSVSKGAYAAVAFNSGSVKLRALVVDTFAKMDTAAMVVTTTSVTGYSNAAENGSLVEVFTAADFTGKLGENVADGPAAPRGWAGYFQVTFGAQASGATLYVRVTDKFGNVTSAPVRVP